MAEVTETPQETIAPPSPGRRGFLTTMFGISGTIVGALLALPLFRFVTFPLRKGADETSWSDVGPAADFASITAPIAKTITLERRYAAAVALELLSVTLPQAKYAALAAAVREEFAPHDFTATL
jgi:menaquinol-cytochrome c reductase iron-sulfur subunit